MKLIIIVILSISSTGYARNPDCTGTPVANDNPISILQWMKNNGNLNKEIADVICCMPMKFRQNYKVSHSSISAQKASYKSARVIFGNLERDNIMFSISGGDQSEPQANSIEVMINNNRAKKLELFDIEYTAEGRRHSSKKNPELCMSCHGNYGEITTGGPRPIFSKLPWQRMTTQGVGSECTHQGGFQKEARRITYEAIKNNPRFRCLPPPGNENDTNIFDDESLERINFRRVGLEMRRNPIFRDVKNFLMGVRGGCLVYFNVKTLQFENNSDVQDWFPKEYMSENTELLMVDSRLKETRNDKEVKDLVVSEIDLFHEQGKQEEQEFKKMLEDLIAGGSPSISSYPKMTKCETADSHKRSFEKLQNTISGYPKNVKIYIYDMVLKSMKNGRFHAGIELIKNSFIRWAYESSGVNTVGWDMSLIPNYSRTMVPVINRFSEYEPYNSIFGNFEASGGSLKKDEFHASCRELMEKSLNAKVITPQKKKPRLPATKEK